MPEFALLIDGEKKEFRIYDEKPDDIPHKGVVWLAVVREYGEPFEGASGEAYVIRTIDPATLPEPVPLSISPRQARLALLAVGKLEEGEALIAQADQATKISWEFATQVNRNDPGIIHFAGLLGFDAGALDDMFRQGAKL